MRLSFNFSTCDDDTGRFASREDFERYLDGFDGVELMCLGPDNSGILEPSHVTGVHLGYFPTWYDFWVGDEGRLIDEFGSLDQVEACYGLCSGCAQTSNGPAGGVPSTSSITCTSHARTSSSRVATAMRTKTSWTRRRTS